MAYAWATVPELPDDAAVELGLDADFADQGAAEAWLTEHYLELTDAGVHQVLLFEEERLVYGPMSLEA
jgi:hypothetical protein